MEKDCIFCRIAHGEASVDMVCQGEDLVAFKDINPISDIPIQTRRSIALIHVLNRRSLPILRSAPLRCPWLI